MLSAPPVAPPIVRALAAIALVIAFFGSLAVVRSALAIEPERFIRIGTGPIGGTYFPVGGLIANAISNPPGSVGCDEGGSCGVPGLIAAAVASQGSIDNLHALAAGRIELALSQGDVAREALRGDGAFAAKPLTNLRSIGNLFPEVLHIVVRRESGLELPNDLRRKKVSIGEPDSGTLATAKTVLSAYRLTPKEFDSSHDKLVRATSRLAEGHLDALLMVGGYPIEAIARLADSIEVRLLPVTGKPAEEIIKAEPTLTVATIPAGTYRGVAATPTVGPRAQLLTSASVDVNLIYAITKALWNPRNRRVLDSGHPEGRHIQLVTAVEGLIMPLHPGAARFYAEIGVKPAGPL